MLNAIDQLLLELTAQGISSSIVLNAIKQVPRDLFVESEVVSLAYEDRPLPIGYGQTISQPLVVARMTQLVLGTKKHLHKVLEIGTGSGYQAAVLAQIADEVYSIERIEMLYRLADKHLTSLNIQNVFLKLADGNEGWVDHAPYDGIIVTAGCQQLAPQWLSQLKPGGCLVLPLDIEGQQYLCRITYQNDLFHKEIFEPVVFVPLLKGIESEG